jgi:hypothetical protein
MEGNWAYFRTRYQVVIGVCLKGWQVRTGLHIYKQWEKQREVIEWARLNVRRGDSVFFECGDCTNFQDMLVLSHFVGV